MTSAAAIPSYFSSSSSWSSGSALVAACGSGDDDGGSGAGAAGTDGKAAEAIPADSLFFTSVNIDSGSDAWKQLIDVGSRFPGWAQVVQEFNTSLNETSEDGTSWSADIQPWLGGEAGIAVHELDVTAALEPEARRAWATWSRRTTPRPRP